MIIWQKVLANEVVDEDCFWIKFNTPDREVNTRTATLKVVTPIAYGEVMSDDVVRIAEMMEWQMYRRLSVADSNRIIIEDRRIEPEL